MASDLESLVKLGADDGRKVCFACASTNVVFSTILPFCLSFLSKAIYKSRLFSFEVLKVWEWLQDYDYLLSFSCFHS